MTRDDLIRLGQGAAGSPWDFMPLAAQALLRAPGDAGLRLLLIANLVRVGLRTAAADHAALLPPEFQTAPEVAGLLRVVRDLPSDIVETPTRIALCKNNLAALGAASPVNQSTFDHWASQSAQTLWCRSSDGNLIARPTDGPSAPADRWRSLADFRPSLQRLVRDHFHPRSPDFARPVYIEGIDPPWLLHYLNDARPKDQTGYRPPIVLVQEDPGQFLDGLSLVDLQPILAAGHVRAFVGPDASSKLAAYLRDRADFQTAGPSLINIATRQRIAPPLTDILAQAAQHQEVLHAELVREVETLYPARPPSFWHARFNDALSPHNSTPLRILILTTRFSTFLQHASRDLAHSLEHLGHRTHLLIEPDDQTKFVIPAYLRAVRDFIPDLVVTINYPRQTLSGAIPANVPFICWIQDAMPHLFNASIGAAQGPLDFTAGHLFDELFDRHKYPRSRALPAPIVADESKFYTCYDTESPQPPIAPTLPHPGTQIRGALPISPRLLCDIAYVSHQSETPEAQHLRLAAEFAKLNIGRALDRLRPKLEHEAFKPLSDLAIVDLPSIVTSILREELGKPPDASLVDIVVRSYCQPIIDRLIRHQALTWAADIADRRGWKLRLYGKGWDQHPRLARYASGPLDHGDDLRQSYAGAGVHLHMMAHALVHQRLIECILSGGFPLCRLHAPERWAIIECLCRQGVRQGAQPIDGLNHPDILKPCRVPSWADAPALMHLAGAMQRLELFDSSFLPIDGARPGPMINEQEWLHPERLREHDPELWSAFLLLGQNEHFLFHSPATLEARIETVLTHRARRDAWSAAARRRFTDRFTYSGFAQRLLAFIRDRLSAETPP